MLALKMELAVESRQQLIKTLHPEQKVSAKNLVRYLALRSEDVRSMQDRLHIHGLSSLASSESHILRQVQAILERLDKTIPDKELSI